MQEPTSANNNVTTPPIEQKQFKPKGAGCLGSTMIIAVIFVLLLIIGIPGCNYYNGMVNREETVSSQWAQVENQYQRRYDLIDNLVGTVKGYAGHEKSTLVEVTEARSSASKIEIKADKIDDATLQKFEAAQDKLSSSLSRLLVTIEKYPELKADKHFTELMAQLKATEDSIAAERATFNSVTKDYNVYIRRFPKNIFAWMFGFDTKPYFKSDIEAKTKVKVDFGTSTKNDTTK
jgi:LemA protein